MSGTTTSASTDRASDQRKLMAVICADMVEYSRLIELDDLGTIERLRVLRTNLIDPAIDEYGGRIVQTGGDSLLIAFDSIYGAVRCAMKVQQRVPQFDGIHPLDRAIRFRVGINFGDAIAEGSDLHGDMVNIAARLQERCPPGGICITRPVRDHVQRRLDVVFEELGPITLKNIAQPVEAFVLRLDAGTAAQKLTERGLYPRRRNSSQPSRPSIAVLPFFEDDPDAEQGYFGGALVEDVVAALAALPDLFVISRASTLKYRDYPPKEQAIADELGVRYILSGRVRRRDRQLRITAELADVETQTVIAPYQVEGAIVDLFTLQDTLVERVVQRISPDIRGAELRRIRRKRPENFDAYDHLLRGLDLLYRLDRNEFDQAHHMFQQAIRLDEDYAAPYAFSGLWHSIRIQQGWSFDRARDLAMSEELASAGVLRDPNDVWALTLLGHLRALLFRDFDAAFDLFARALHSSPNSAFTWSRSSPAFSYIGDTTEARRRAEEALRLSPFDPHIFWTHSALGLAAYTEGDYPTAVMWGRRSHVENRAFTANLRFLAASLAANGQFEEAQHIGKSLCRLAPDFAVRRFVETYAYRDEQFRARLAQHLLLAGLPE
jgi:adenylate cyclase